MLFFSFDSPVFNKGYEYSNISMVVSVKAKYASPHLFMKEAFRFIDEEIYPEEDIITEYAGAHLKEGRYSEIVKRWIATMSEKVDIQMDKIIKTYRIKCPSYRPFNDDFILETTDEYIMFLWSTSA